MASKATDTPNAVRQVSKEIPEPWKITNATTRSSDEYVQSIYGGPCSIKVAAALLEVPYNQIREALWNREIPFTGESVKAIRIEIPHLAVFAQRASVTPTSHLLIAVKNALLPPSHRVLPGEFTEG